MEQLKNTFTYHDAGSGMLNATHLRYFSEIEKGMNSTYSTYATMNYTGTFANASKTAATAMSPIAAEAAARMFVPVLSSSWWLVGTILATAVSLYTYHNVTFQVSSRTIAYANLLASTIATVPFAAFMMYKLSWAGSAPDEAHRFIIENVHLVSMFAWVLCSFAMILSICFRSIRLHKALGWLAMNIHLPFIIVELSVNAGRAFVPSKLIALAQGHWPDTAADPTILQWSAMALPMIAALSTPAIIGMFWWFGRCIYDKKRFPKADIRHRLHVLYMTMLNTTVFSTGLIRWLFRLCFKLTGCPMYKDDILSVYAQHLAGNYNALIYIPACGFIYATLPKEMRVGDNKVRSVQISFTIYMCHGLLQLLSTYLMDFSFFYRCDAGAVQEFLAARV